MGRSKPSPIIQDILDTPEPYAPGEVAVMFGVHPKTVSRWADAGRLESFWTPGGHRRFPCEATRKSLQDATAGRWK